MDKFRGKDLDRGAGPALDPDPEHDRGVLAQVMDHHAWFDQARGDWDRSGRRTDENRSRDTARDGDDGLGPGSRR